MDAEEGWLVVVKVGGDGKEVRIGMQPHSKICELHSKVQAECGVSGKLWPVSTETDFNEPKPLWFESTVRECWVFHLAVIWLETEDSFCAERDALTALLVGRCQSQGNSRNTLPSFQVEYSYTTASKL
jgi:hypothetical protein